MTDASDPEANDLATNALEAALRALVERSLGRGVSNLEWLTGQLGLRRFARLHLEAGGDDAAPASLIARCDSPEDPAGRPVGIPPEPPLEPIRALLEASGLPVPKRYGAAEGIELLEDLGDESLRRRVARHPEQTRNLYSEACDWIVRLQSVATAPIPAFDRRLDDALLRYKADLFARYGLRRASTADERGEILSAFDRIAAVVAAAPQRLSHRDYQSANLMLRRTEPVGRRLAMIDLQGAFLAPPEYDLVCLLRDSYVELEDSEVRNQLARIRPLLPDAPAADVFERRFDLLTLSRKCKDLARFIYAAQERDDTRYLTHVPATLRYLGSAARRAAAREPAFERFANIIAEIPEPA